MYRFTFILLLITSIRVLAQDTRFCDNYIGCSHWGMSYLKIKKSGKVMLYTNGCVDRGTRRYGTWSSEGDTITLSFVKSEMKYILKEGKLCYYSDEGVHGNPISGIPRTTRTTVSGAINKCRHIRIRSLK